MLEITSTDIRVLRVLDRREAYRMSAQIGQEVSEAGEIAADEMADSDGTVVAAEPRLR